MIATIVAWVGGSLAVYAAWRSKAGVTVDDGASTALRAFARWKAGAAAAFDDSRAGNVCREVLTPETAVAGLAELRITLSEVQRDAEQARAVPRAAARIALALGTAAALVDLARSLTTDHAGVPVAAVVSFVGGLLASAVVGGFGRRATAKAVARDRAWTELASVLARHVVGASGTVGMGTGPHAAPETE